MLLLYVRKFLKTWRNLKPILFVPDLMLLFFNVFAAILALKYLGLFDVLNDPEIFINGIAGIIPLIADFVKTNLFRVVLTAVLFLLSSFIFGAGAMAMKYGMLYNVSRRKDVSFKIMFSLGGKRMWDVALLRAITYFISIVAFLFLLGSQVIMRHFFPGTFSTLFLILLTPITLFSIQLALFFRYPTMFIDKTNSVSAIRNSVSFFKRETLHVLFIWMIIMVITLGGYLFNGALGYIPRYFAYNTDISIGLLGSILFIAYVATSVVNLLISVWAELFKFYNYKLKVQD